jgi:8-oxo-dGTP pyrophosphatase MutT (NUDIX family)
MRNSSKSTAPKRVQYGALPYRLGAGLRPQFMLITSRDTRRWVIPKGWPKKGTSPRHSAAREAFEEAGVVGAVAKRAAGSFSYEKRMKNGGVVVCEVRVFPLQVRRQNKQWPEKQERVVKWLSASQAAEKVKDPILSDIIRRLARKYDGTRTRVNSRTTARERQLKSRTAIRRFK